MVAVAIKLTLPELSVLTVGVTLRLLGPTSVVPDPPAPSLVQPKNQKLNRQVINNLMQCLYLTFNFSYQEFPSAPMVLKVMVVEVKANISYLLLPIPINTNPLPGTIN